MAAQSEWLGSARLGGHGHSLIRIILQNAGVITGIYPHQERRRLGPCAGQQQRFRGESEDRQGRGARAARSGRAVRTTGGTHDYTRLHGSTPFIYLV